MTRRTPTMLEWWKTRSDAINEYRRLMREPGLRVSTEPEGEGDVVESIPIELVGGPYDGSHFPMPKPYFRLEKMLSIPVSQDKQLIAVYLRPSLVSLKANFVNIVGFPDAQQPESE